MSELRFIKILSANDVGKTKSHQSGMLIPRSQPELIEALGPLDISELNPRKIVKCVDDLGTAYSFNFIYYNNKLFSVEGTRNEFRLTGTTKFFNSCGADEGDEFIVIVDALKSYVEIKLVKQGIEVSGEPIKLSGWRKIH